MKNFSILLLIAIIGLFAIPSIYAQGLPVLPSLEGVMQKNKEYLEKTSKGEAKPRIKNKKNTRDIVEKVENYKTIITGNAINISRYNTIDLWVQEIDLSKGARLTSILTQNGYDQTSGEPLFEKKTISEVLSEIDIKPFSIINGQFFDPRRRYTPLSFGVKEGPIIRTAGADNRNESKNILIIHATGAKLLPYSWDNLHSADGLLAIVNLTMNENKYKKDMIGRTYICIQHMNQDHEGNNLAIFTAVGLSEVEMEREFPRWGCNKNSIAKLDASGSTRLWVAPQYCEGHKSIDSCSGESIYGKSHKGDPDYRKIPHYLAVWDE